MCVVEGDVMMRFFDEGLVHPKNPGDRIALQSKSVGCHSHVRQPITVSKGSAPVSAQPRWYELIYTQNRVVDNIDKKNQ